MNVQGVRKPRPTHSKPSKDNKAATCLQHCPQNIKQDTKSKEKPPICHQTNAKKTQSHHTTQPIRNSVSPPNIHPSYQNTPPSAGPSTMRESRKSPHTIHQKNPKQTSRSAPIHHPDKPYQETTRDLLTYLLIYAPSSNTDQTAGTMLHYQPETAKAKAKCA